MDTNVFISNLKPDDPYHGDARTILNLLRRKEIRAETSTLTLLEASSVASRLYQRAHGGESTEERKAFVVKTVRSLTELGIKFVHIAGDAPVVLGDMKANAPNIVNDAILLSIHVALRTLDLMHVAAARHAKQNNHDLGAFVTGDAELLRMKADLSKITGLAFLSPSEYVRGLGLR